jgi:N-acetylglutamate synthase-like GNAT family acetyltransferase
MFTYRQAVAEDIPDMVELLRQLFSIEKDFNFNQGKHRAGLLMLFHDKSSKIFIAEKQKRVVGMCTLQVLTSSAEGAKVGLLEDLIVDENCRHEGVGSQLLEAATEWAKKSGLKRIQLLADKGNIPALNFYHKYNWSSTNLICIRKLLY